MIRLLGWAMRRIRRPPCPTIRQDASPPCPSRRSMINSAGAIYPGKFMMPGDGLSGLGLTELSFLDSAEHAHDPPSLKGERLPRFLSTSMSPINAVGCLRLIGRIDLPG